MTENTPDEEFWEVADSFVHLANQHLECVERGKVSAAFLYAAARFNAFVVAAAAKSSEGMAKDTGPALEYFTEQYGKMLRENLAEQVKNLDKYKE